MYNYCKPLYQLIKDCLVEHPNLSRREAARVCAVPRGYARTNPVRERFKGVSEITRRKSQIERGFIRVSAGGFK